MTGWEKDSIPCRLCALNLIVQAIIRLATGPSEPPSDNVEAQLSQARVCRAPSRLLLSKDADLSLRFWPVHAQVPVLI